MTKDKEDKKAVKCGKDEHVTAEPEQKKAKLIAEQGELEKPVVSKERNIDLQLDLEKLDRDMGTDSSLSGNKSNQPIQKQPLQSEKTGNSLLETVLYFPSFWLSGVSLLTALFSFLLCFDSQLNPALCLCRCL